MIANFAASQGDLNEIKSLDNELTIIIIAHRISSLKGCNRIFKLENKSIKEVNLGINHIL